MSVPQEDDLGMGSEGWAMTRVRVWPTSTCQISRWASPETACLMPRFDLCVLVTYYQSLSRSRVAREAEVLWPQQCVRGM